MNVVICDYEKGTCNKLEDCLLNYAAMMGGQIVVDVFYSGDTLIKYLTKGNKPNILFLEIELPGIDGIRIGEFVRDQLINNQMYIVYISSKEQYALQLFKIHPFDFLIKPLNKEVIFKVITNIFKMIYREDYYFKFQIKKMIYRISYNEILYLHSTGKKINIILYDGVQSFYGKLSELDLQEFYFWKIHKSFLVNVIYIREYTYEWVKMVNGDILNISKANRTAVRKRIREGERCGLINF